jgi:hypothetical protein
MSKCLGNYCVPADCEMKDRVHYMIKDCLLSRKMPSYFCCENIFLSTSGKHIWSPTFVQTLVSPYHGRQSDANKNKMIVNAGSRKVGSACLLYVVISVSSLNEV